MQCLSDPAETGLFITLAATIAVYAFGHPLLTTDGNRG